MHLATLNNDHGHFERVSSLPTYRSAPSPGGVIPRLALKPGEGTSNISTIQSREWRTNIGILQTLDSMTLDVSDEEDRTRSPADDDGNAEFESVVVLFHDRLKPTLS